MIGEKPKLLFFIFRVYRVRDIILLYYIVLNNYKEVTMKKKELERICSEEIYRYLLVLKKETIHNQLYILLKLRRNKKVQFKRETIGLELVKRFCQVCGLKLKPHWLFKDNYTLEVQFQDMYLIACKVYMEYIVFHKYHIK